MSIPYGNTKKARLEAYIGMVCLDILPEAKDLADTIGLSPSAVRAALKEWASNRVVVVIVDGKYLKQSYCPECTDGMRQYERGDYKLIGHTIFRTAFDGTLIYAKCQHCRKEFVSRNRGEYVEAAK